MYNIRIEKVFSLSQVIRVKVGTKRNRDRNTIHIVLYTGRERKEEIVCFMKKMKEEEEKTA